MTERKRSRSAGGLHYRSQRANRLMLMQHVHRMVAGCPYIHQHTYRYINIYLLYMFCYFTICAPSPSAHICTLHTSPAHHPPTSPLPRPQPALLPCGVHTTHSNALLNIKGNYPSPRRADTASCLTGGMGFEPGTPPQHHLPSGGRPPPLFLLLRIWAPPLFSPLLPLRNTAPDKGRNSHF